MAKHAMIATWPRTYDAVKQAFPLLQGEDTPTNGILNAVCCIEDDPSCTTVGYGGIPNRNGIVELDAAYMRGDDLGFGAVMGTVNLKNPIRIAHSLVGRDRNCVLCGDGAMQYAMQHGFPMANMLTESSAAVWKARLQDLLEQETMAPNEDEHDTVCVIGKCGDHIDIGVSTSGLGMKHPGRIGDSPLIGSGLYADSEVGAAGATGLGEDIMKGCLSYEIVRLMKQGIPVQKACETAVWEHCRSFARRGWKYDNMAVVALDKDGNYGAAANHVFTFVYQNDDCPTLRLTVQPREDGSMEIVQE